MPPKKPKFYAVRVGKVPGVYLTPEECKAQLKGHPFSTSRMFKKREDAWAFVNQPNLPSKRSERPTTSTNIRTRRTKPVVKDDGGESSKPRNLKRELEPGKAIDIRNISTTTTSRETSDRSSTVTIKELNSVEPREKPNWKRRRIDTSPTFVSPPSLNPTAVPELDSITKAFFTSLKYTNPTAFTKLAETGFGIHELLSMRDLPPSTISSRFKNLLGHNKPQLAAQIESLAFVVAHAKEAIWEELERQVQLC